MKISPAVLAVLEAATPTADGIRLNGQLDRKLYMDVDKVLKATGWTWNRGAKLHKHPNADAAAALDSLLSTGEVVTAQDMGFFETTGAALDRLMELGDVQPGNLILEPSAGSGNIVRRCLQTEGTRVHVCEPQEKFAEQLLALITPRGGRRLVMADFLTIKPEPLYDRVLMNPPFAKQADLDHVRHAMKFLKPGGRLVTIMASGVRYRQNRKTLEFLEAIAGYSPRFEDLPPGSFKAVGTNVNTCILVLDAPA